MKSIEVIGRNVRRALISLVLAASWLAGLAQFTTGLLLDDGGYDLLPRQSLYGDGGKSESQALEGVLKADLRPYCPPPKNQGRISSCVGWAIGYAALTIHHAIQKGWRHQPDSIRHHAFSALFIYNQIKIGGCGSGAYISEGLKFLATSGDIRSEEFDSDLNNCETLPAATQRIRAEQFRIRDFTTLFGDMADPALKIYKTKLSLAQNKPVVVGMEIRENFQSLTARDAFWFPDAGSIRSLGGHAMCVVGFDEGRGAFEIMNSWGPYWGQGGFMWVKYDDFARFCRFAAQLTPEPLPEAAPGLRQAAFRLRQPVVAAEGGRLTFAEVKPVAASNRYLLQRKKGDRIQWTATGITPGSYLYVFSFDQAKQVKVHWPRDEALDARFKGDHESALVTASEVELVIPTPTTVFVFNQTGRDHIVALLASRPVPDLNTVLANLPGAYRGDLHAALRQVFGSRIANVPACGYGKETMGINSQAPANQIIPVVLEVTISP